MYTVFFRQNSTQGYQVGLQPPNWRKVLVPENGTILAGERLSGVTASGDFHTAYRINGLFQ